MGAIRSIARGLALAGAVAAGGALAVTASSVLATPQPLESALEGESRIFRSRRGDVFYTARGPADAQPILLLHGVHLSASSFTWRKNFAALGQSFRLYAPDLPGFGLSDRPAMDYTADLYVQFICDFAREVIARPAIVVAHNRSAAFAVRAAHLDSRLFNRLALISPTGILPEESRDWPARSGGLLQSVLRRISETTVGQVPYALLTTKPALAWLVARQSYANPEHITPEVVQHLYATTHQFGARFAPLAFMSGKLDIDVSDDFAALSQPTLLIWGEQDTINDSIHAEALSKLNPHTRLELIAQAGNAVQEEQANEVNELLRAWFLAPPELVDPTLRGQSKAAVSAPSKPTPAEQATPPAPAPEAQATPPTPEAPAEWLIPPELETPVTAPTPHAAEAGAEPSPAPDEQTSAEAPAPTPEAAASAAPQEEPASAASQPHAKETQRRASSRSTGARTAAGQTRQSRAAQRESARQAQPDSGDTPPSPRSASSRKKK